MLFIPSGHRYSYSMMADAVIMVIRLYNSIKLCERYPIERLFEAESYSGDNFEKQLRVLKIDSHVWYLINGLAESITNGIKCKHYFDMKIKEFFLILRLYYSENEQREFFYPILSGDTVFSEYVRGSRNKYPTVMALAESMCMTQKQFSKKFREIFGRTAYGWMKEGRAETLRYEITSTKKPFKQIADENGFGTISQFTKFCKKELGKNPKDLRDNT